MMDDRAKHSKPHLTAAAILMLFLAGCTGGVQQPAASPVPTAASTPSVTGSPAPRQTPADTQAPAVTPAPDTVCYVNGEGVRLRDGADADAAVLCTLPHGLALIKLKAGQEWTKVRYDDMEGYISSELLSGNAPEITLPAPRSLSAPAIVVKKAKRKLELWDGSALVAVFPVGLGFAPEGHKQAEGDGRTPEGDYYVCVRNRSSRFYLSLGVSYPNKADAKAALDDGRIDRRTYERIADAIDAKERPSWSTPLGGEIMIHGHGSASDWTLGCVAVDNAVMDILFAACPLGTPITILP